MKLCRLIVATLVLQATPALAVKSILIVGDSLGASQTVFPGTVYKTNAHAVDRELRSLLARGTAGGKLSAGGTVTSWSVPASTPGDWSPGPPSALVCAAEATAWPPATAGCRDNAAMLSYIPTGYDYVFIIDNGIASPLTTSQYVDSLQTLATALDAVNGTVYISPPPHGPASGTTAMPADGDRTAKIAVRTEEVSRGIINGPDWTDDLPMCVDGIHFRDHGYEYLASKIYAALP